MAVIGTLDWPNRDIVADNLGAAAADDLAAIFQRSDEELILPNGGSPGSISNPQDLASSAAGVRLWAAIRLAEIRDHRAVEPLIGYLMVPSWMVSVYGDRAVEALLKTGDPRAWESLLAIIENSPGFSENMVLTGRLLQTCKDPRALPALILAYHDLTGRQPENTLPPAECDPELYRAAIVSFGPAARPALLEAARRMASFAPEGSTTIADSADAQTLLAMVRGQPTAPDENEKLETLKTIREMSPDLDIVVANLDGMAMLSPLGWPPDTRAIEPFRALLAKLPPRPAEPIVWRGHTAAEAWYIYTPEGVMMSSGIPMHPQPQMTQANHSIAVARLLVTRMLLALGDAEAVGPALAADPGLQEEARSLPRLSQCTARLGPAAMPALEAALSDPSWSVRAEAAQVLVMMDDPNALAALRRTFDIQDTAYVRQFLDIFKNMDDHKAPVTTLLALAEEHKHRYVRQEAIRQLGKVKDPRVLPAFRRIAAGDVCRSVRTLAWDYIEQWTTDRRPDTLPAFWQNEIDPFSEGLTDE